MPSFQALRFAVSWSRVCVRQCTYSTCFRILPDVSSPSRKTTGPYMLRMKASCSGVGITTPCVVLGRSWSLFRDAAPPRGGRVSPSPEFPEAGDPRRSTPIQRRRAKRGRWSTRLLQSSQCPSMGARSPFRAYAG